MVFVSFLVSIPGLVLQTNRGWLKAFGWSTILSAIFTLVLGLDIWFSTLKTRSNLRSMWARESPQTQSLLQQRVRDPNDERWRSELTEFSSTAVAIWTR